MLSVIFLPLVSIALSNYGDLVKKKKRIKKKRSLKSHSYPILFKSFDTF